MKEAKKKKFELTRVSEISTFYILSFLSTFFSIYWHSTVHEALAKAFKYVLIVFTTVL